MAVLNDVSGELPIRRQVALESIALAAGGCDIRVNPQFPVRNHSPLERRSPTRERTRLEHFPQDQAGVIRRRLVLPLPDVMGQEEIPVHWSSYGRRFRRQDADRTGCKLRNDSDLLL